MRIDVSDLFDEMFAMATIAYRSFRLDAQVAEDWDWWRKYCCDLSNSFFVPLVARRAFQLTHERHLAFESLKRQIIVQTRFGGHGIGFNMWYERPRFYESASHPSAFDVRFSHNNLESTREFLTRPRHSLFLHVGPIPPTEYDVENGSYDPGKPLSYYRIPVYETMFSGRQTVLYETRGDWIVRSVTMAEALGRHLWKRPCWTDLEKCEPISAELFLNMWNLAEGKDDDDRSGN